MKNRLLTTGFEICKAIGDYINNNESSTKFNNENISLVCDFAKKHNIEAILGGVLSTSDNAPYNDLFKDSLSGACFKQIKFDIMCDKISEAFSQKQIKHILLKGKEIQKFYPHSLVRNTTDIDYYIDKNDINLASDILFKLGFTLNNVNKDRDYLFVKEPRYTVELHTTLEGYNKQQENALKNLIKNAVCVKEYLYAFSDTDCYIHAMFHLYKHFVYSGVGVRMFLDLYVICKNGDINYKYADDILKKIGIYDFSKTVLDINQTLFNNQPAKNELTEVYAFIFESGIFGTTDTSLHLEKIKNEIKGLNKFQVFSNNMGLSFYAMKKRYPILQKAPILYPFSFIHRFIYGIIFRRDELKKDKEIKSKICDERIEKLDSIFKKVKIIK